MLTNAMAAAVLGVALLVVLLLQLNPQIPLAAGVTIRLGARLMLFYGVAIVSVFYAATLVWQLFPQERLSPGWLSVRLLAWMGAALVTAAAALMWVNLIGYRAVLELEASRAMAAGAGATSVSALLLLFIAVVHNSFGRRGSRVGGALLALTLAATLGLPLGARGRGGRLPPVRSAEPVSVVAPRPTPGRILLLALDGASLDYISAAAAAGRLPNFGRMLDGGAAMRLATLRPTQPAPVWAAVATGKLPPRNGVRSAAAYAFDPGTTRVELLPDLALSHALVRFGLFEELSHRAYDLRAWPIWDLLSQAGIRVGVTGWPVTDPARAVDGYVVTDRFHVAALEPARYPDADIGYPAEAVRAAREAAARLAHDQTEVEALARGRIGAGPGPWLERVPLVRDFWYRQLAAQLEAAFAPQFIVRRYVGLDWAGHYFLRYAVPREFGDVSDQEISRFGRTLDRHYGYIDEEIGAAMSGLGPEDLLLVVSGFGMDPVSPGKRLLATVLGEADLSGTHERGPAGFMLAYGAAVLPARLSMGSVFDVAPTVLYYFGLPLARDMDGYPRTDMFGRRFTEEHPVTFIPTYDR
jgi:hypothetical protein